jgi:hypothetical protein
MGKQLAAYGELARQTTDERLNAFERDLLERFSNQETGNTSAFADPDFQQVVRDAQREYVRSDDDALHGTLIDLVAKRSFETDRTRLSLTLNRAVERSAYLTKAEFAALAFSFMAARVRVPAATFEQIAEHVEKRLRPLALDVVANESSYTHIESVGCATIERLTGGSPIESILIQEYPLTCVRGLHADKWKKAFGDIKASDSWVEPHSQHAHLLTPKFPLSHFHQVLAAWKSLKKLPADLSEDGWKDAIEAMSADEVKAKILELSPSSDVVFETWMNTPVKFLRLNTTGIAIAHAYASRTVGILNAPLGIWVN